MRLSKKNKAFFSIIATCLLIVVTLATGKSPQEIFEFPQKSQQQSVQGIQTDKQRAKVIKVADGDTITVEINGAKEKIRVIGINTPESVDPRRPVECFGKEASNFAKETLLGQTILLESDASQAEKDRYGRLLRFVWINNETVDYGKLAISEGFAQEYTYEVPHKYQVEYRHVQQSAQEKKNGLWSDTACMQEK